MRLTHLLSFLPLAAFMPFTPNTVITMPFVDGGSRSFHYSRILGTREANYLLDQLLDEMKGSPFNGPIEIHRHRDWREVDIETVGLLSVED